MKFFRKNHLFKDVSKKIHSGDGMAKGGHAQYFEIGANAAWMISESMAAARLQPGEVKRVLDYACGYGRVLRWLVAEYPEADVLGVDVNEKAVASIPETIGATSQVLDPRLTAPLGDPFDLIWVGSLFTHLTEKEALRVLKYLRRHLTENGVLVFTTHGTYVADRIQSREKTYNIPESQIDSMLSRYRRYGYGFASYEGQKDYGISVSTVGKTIDMITRSDLEPKYFRARGWGAHQDVFACVPAKP